MKKVKKMPVKKVAATFLWVAGFRVGFESDSVGIIAILRRRYRPFMVSGGAVKKVAATFLTSERAGGASPFKPAVRWRGSRLELARGDFRAALDLGTGVGELAAAPNKQCLDAFLRSLTSSFLLRSGGFMLHSAGIVKNGKAYLFLGKSRAGKSTLSKLAAAAGVEVISDEINLVRSEKGRFRVYGSPFWGEMRSDGRQADWPLGGIFLLKKAKGNRVRKAATGESLKLLLRCLVNFEKSPGTAELALKNASRLLAKVKFNRLEFSKADSSFLSSIGKA